MIDYAFTILIRGGTAVYNWFIQILNAIGGAGTVLGILSVSIGFRFLIYPMLKPSAGHSDSANSKNNKNEEE